MSRTALVYYVTSHGFGHFNRAAAVVEAIPQGIRVVVKTDRALFARWRESVRRGCELIEGVFDCGAVHPPGESSLVDAAATLESYRRVHAAAQSRLAEEVTFLRSGDFAAVVSDIAPLPLCAARQASIPGILVANFTWADIFEAYVCNGQTSFRPMLHEMRREYQDARLVLRAQPAMDLKLSSAARDVGLVGRRGRSRRRELLSELGLPSRSRLVYVYVGRYGQEDVEWGNLKHLGDFDFISYHRIDAGVRNWHCVDPWRWPPRDLAASVDVMVAKAGYGTVTDAMIHRTPLIFPPRFGFAEHRVLAAGLRRWGGGIAVRSSEFKQLRLRVAVEAAMALKPRVAPWPRDGARRCVREILRLVRSCRLTG